MVLVHSASAPGARGTTAAGDSSALASWVWAAFRQVAREGPTVAEVAQSLQDVQGRSRCFRQLVSAESLVCYAAGVVTGLALWLLLDVCFVAKRAWNRLVENAVKVLDGPAAAPAAADTAFFSPPASPRHAVRRPGFLKSAD